jgi:hypothetical protein
MHKVLFQEGGDMTQLNEISGGGGGCCDDTGCC